MNISLTLTFQHSDRSKSTFDVTGDYEHGFDAIDPYTGPIAPTLFDTPNDALALCVRVAEKREIVLAEERAKRDKYIADTPEEARWKHYEWACESWSECFAEAGSGHVFGGGSSTDASWVAREAAGPQPKLSDFGLKRPVPPVPPKAADWTTKRVTAYDDSDPDAIPF